MSRKQKEKIEMEAIDTVLSYESPKTIFGRFIDLIEFVGECIGQGIILLTALVGTAIGIYFLFFLP